MSQGVFYWVAHAAFALILVGLSVGTFSLKTYLSRLETLIVHLKGKERRLWRSLGSPDVPLSVGFSSSSSGRKTMAFLFRGAPAEKSSPEMASMRTSTRNAFLMFAAGVMMVFAGLATVPLAVALVAALR